MKVNEIFYSIQGESLSIGFPTIFVRFTGCNLRCTYCDTTYAYEDGQEMSLPDIFARIRTYQCKRVCLTGGEPLLQKEINQLLNMLDTYSVSVETNGSVPIEKYELRNGHRFIMDMKSPSSGCSDSMILENLDYLSENDEIKFVVADKKDYDWTKMIITDKYSKGIITIAPVFGSLEYSTLAEWILRDNLNVRMGLQFHKIIWSPELRGV
jgi:7-carboxy-7-deazaguanine synthase